MLERRERTMAVVLALLATPLVGYAAAMTAIDRRRYGFALFVVIPYVIGLLATTVYRYGGRRNLVACLMVAAGAGVGVSGLFLLLGKEGLICILLAVPLAMPLVWLGAFTGYVLFHRTGLAPRGGTALLALVAMASAIYAESTYPLESSTYTVSDSIVIAAPASAVWEALISMGQLGQPRDLLFRLGVACPQRVDIYGRGEGALRVCTLTTGQLPERITAWEPGVRLEWVSVSTPAPLTEINPFHHVDPPHLHGFYRSVGGEFDLRPLAAAKTLVVRRSSYQHNMFPGWYWRLWCDYVASRGHVHVLGVLKAAAESAVQHTAANVPPI